MAVYPKIKAVPVEPEPDLLEQRPATDRLVHGSGDVPDLELAGPQPLEVARFLAVEDRRNKARRADLRPRSGRRRNVGDKELVGDRPLEQPVDVAKMPPEQVVELGVVLGRVVV